MNDPCGWPENFAGMRPCSVWSPGANGQPGGSEDTGASFVGCTSGGSCTLPGVTAQAQWDAKLATEIMTHNAVLGGFIFEWADEFWKVRKKEKSSFEPSAHPNSLISFRPFLFSLC